jgi:hypothetical protein
MTDNIACHLQNLVRNTQDVAPPAMLFQRCSKLVRKSLKNRIRFFFISIGRKLGLIPLQGPQPLVEDLRLGENRPS